jgi:hypothetical protein
MGYLGCILFGMIFLFLNPKVREMITSRLGMSTEWISGCAPFSYIVIGLLFMAPLVGFIVLKTAPKIEEPENPLAKYKREAAMLDDTF